MNKNSRKELEGLIKRCGLPSVLSMLSGICSDKSAHNPQHPAGKLWMQMSHRLATTSNAAKDKGL